MMRSGERIEGARIVLGEEGCERCRFVRCELVFDGRPVHLVDNSFEDCDWSFEGAAGVTLDFVAALCRDDAEMRASLAHALGLIASPTRRRSASGMGRTAPSRDAPARPLT